MRTRYKIINNEAFHFVTSTTVEWVKVFKCEKYYNILIDAIKFYQAQKRLEIIAYVLLPNHFHLVVYSKELVNIMKLIKAYSAKEILKLLKKDGEYKILELLRINKKDYKTHCDYQFWQEGFKPKEIFREKMLYQKIKYIHLNPVKLELVTEPAEWRYSSAGFYETGDEGVIKLDVEY
jgi:REP element-mobilizing transposase RayT